MKKLKYFLISILLILFSVNEVDAQNGWFWQNPLPQGNSINSVDFIDSNTGWVVGDNGTILITTDGAENWNLLNSGVTENLHTVQAFAKDNLVYAVGENGTVLKTTNDGQNWTAQTTAATGIHKSFFIDINSGWLVGNGGVILHSMDAGLNWIPQTSGTTENLNSVVFVNADTGIAVGSKGISLLTLNAGETWNIDTLSFVNTISNLLKKSNNEDYKAGNAYEFEDHSVLTVAVGTNGIVATRDGLNSPWVIQNSGVSFDLHSVFIVDNKNGKILIIAAGDNGCIIFSSDRGITWTPSFYGDVTLSLVIGFFNFPVSILNKNSESKIDQLKLIVGGNFGKIGVSTNNGQTWETKSKGPVRNLNCISNIGLKLWTGGQAGQILFSSDGGDKWIAQNTGTTNTFNSITFADEYTGWVASNFLGQGEIRKTTNGGNDWNILSSNIPAVINYLSFIDSSTGWIVGANGEVFKSIDGGESWNPQISGVTSSLNSVNFIDENYGWIAGSGGIILNTIDGGAVWNIQNSGTSKNLRSIFAINANTVFTVGISGTILKTSDSGESWKPQSSGTSSYLRSVFFVDEYSGWAAGFNGTILGTTDGGNIWTSLNSGTRNDLESIIFSDAGTGWSIGEGGTILKTTNGGGVTFIDEHKNNRLPADFVLYQNYPNPFNPITKIQFQIASSSQVYLKVYDVLGNEVATLVNENKPAGDYEISFDASGLTSGVYLYKVQTGDFVDTKKMILLR